MYNFKIFNLKNYLENIASNEDTENILNNKVVHNQLDV